MAQLTTRLSPPVSPTKVVAGSAGLRLRASIGFWSALLVGVCPIGFLVINLATPSRPWKGMAAYISAFNFEQMFWMIPLLVMMPGFVVLMACIKAGTSEDRQLLADIGLVFATLYAAISMTNYSIQLLAVGPSISGGRAQDLGFLAMNNPSGLFIALEGLSYPLQQIGMLFVAFVFVGSGLNRWIRWSFLATSVGSYLLAAPIAAVAPASLMQFLGGYGFFSVNTDLWAVFLAATGILLAVYFRRIQEP